jgi:hypothetical protein
MAELLSVAITAVSLAKFAVVGSGEDGKSAVYKRFRSGPRTLPWGTPAFTGAEFCVFIFNLDKEASAMQVGL